MSKNIGIVGGGIGGLMTAYHLVTRNIGCKVQIFEKGHILSKRYCPSSSNHSKCVHCKVCSITTGLGGSGSFSDGKYNIGTAYGGTLGDELGEEKALSYIRQANDILQSFLPKGVTITKYGTDESLQELCHNYNLKLLPMDVVHYGTDNNYIVMKNLIAFLINAGVEFHTDCEIVSVEQRKDHSYIVVDSNKNQYCCSYVVIATGRNGTDFVKSVCGSLGVEMKSNTVDLGVRVEMLDSVWRNFSEKIYEPKILYTTKTFQDKCRMFCFNQGGIVAAENNDGITTVNGHSFSAEDKKTKNCNFAILSSINFAEPFDHPSEYVKHISQLANYISDNSVIVQRFGDLINGRRTTAEGLKNNSVVPTLNAFPGNLSLVLPHRIVINIIETLYALNDVAPGTSGDDTLLYGVEGKYYSLKPVTDKNFQLKDNLFIIGDGSGVTRGLSQAAAMGLYVADYIGQQNKVDLYEKL